MGAFTASFIVGVFFFSYLFFQGRPKKNAFDMRFLVRTTLIAFFLYTVAYFIIKEINLKSETLLSISLFITMSVFFASPIFTSAEKYHNLFRALFVLFFILFVVSIAL